MYRGLPHPFQSLKCNRKKPWTFISIYMELSENRLHTKLTVTWLPVYVNHCHRCPFQRRPTVGYCIWFDHTDNTCLFIHSRLLFLFSVLAITLCTSLVFFKLQFWWERMYHWSVQGTLLFWIHPTLFFNIWMYQYIFREKMHWEKQSKKSVRNWSLQRCLFACSVIIVKVYMSFNKGSRFL